MRSLSARLAALVLPVLFVVMGVAHTAHAHPADEASTVHPTCTLCQFHAPVGAPGEVQGVATDPGPGAILPMPSTETRFAPVPARINATRAPPALLAI
jgi:hypothetical protein